jgi:hypothetical protein
MLVEVSAWCCASLIFVVFTSTVYLAVVLVDPGLVLLALPPTAKAKKAAAVVVLVARLRVPQFRGLKGRRFCLGALQQPCVLLMALFGHGDACRMDTPLLVGPWLSQGYGSRR